MLGMEGGVEKLQRIGLTEYEARTYLSLLNDSVSTAVKLAEKSGVPRTRIYSVLESLARKGWVKICSGVPLLFKAVKPHEVLERTKKEYAEFLESIQTTLTKEVNTMIDKFVIKKFDLGLEGLKEELKKAKTVQISNATADFVQKVKGAFSKDAKIKVLLFPGQKVVANGNIDFKQAEVQIVCVIRGREVPSMSIILDENRVFTAFEDPVSHRYIVDEMLYDECAKCFEEWYQLGWDANQAIEA